MTKYLYEVWSTGDFMMKMMKFQKMPELFNAKVRGNNGNFPNCNTDKCIAVPNEGNK